METRTTAPSDSGSARILENLAAGVTRGAKWNVTGGLALQLIRSGFAIALARLLTPEAYGAARMVLVVGPLVIALSDLGLGVGLIQRNRITQTDRSTVFWATAALGATWAIIGVATAGFAADFYGRPSLTPMFRVYALAFFLGGLGATHASLLQREANFRGLQLRVLGATVLSGIAAVIAAAEGLGAWSIIVQQVALSAADTALLWYFSSWRPTFDVSRESLRKFGGFGLGVFGSKLMFFFNRNTDNALVGRYLGAAPLGVYSVAYNVMLTPLTRLMWPIQTTLGPYLMRMQDAPERMTRTWLRTLRVVTAVLLPATVGMMIVAPDLIDVVVGRRWHAAGPVLRVLAIAALLQSTTLSVPDILVAMGRVKTLFNYSIFSTALQVGGFVIGVHWGLMGVAYSYAITNALLAPLFLSLGARTLGVGMTRFIPPFARAAAVTAGMAAAALALRLWLDHVGIASGFRLCAVVACGVAVYGLLSLRTQREVVDDLRRLATRRTLAETG